jgi:PA domain
VEQAEKAGCIGMILYSDPADYAVDGITSVYPDSWWLPGTGVQRGTIKKSDGGLGDPLTPMYPATGRKMFFVFLLFRYLFVLHLHLYVSGRLLADFSLNVKPVTDGKVIYAILMEIAS